MEKISIMDGPPTSKCSHVTILNFPEGFDILKGDIILKLFILIFPSLHIFNLYEGLIKDNSGR